MEIVYRKLADLTPNPKNPRDPKDERSVVELAESIKGNPKFFEARPILLSDRTGELIIIAGEQRSKAARILGYEEVPTILISGLTEAQQMLDGFNSDNSFKHVNYTTKKPYFNSRRYTATFRPAKEWTRFVK